MLGDPYAYDIPSTQKFYIDINPDIQYVTYSELEEHPVKLTTFVDNTWTYPSGYTPVGKEYDVEFSNLQIYEVKPVPEEYQTGYYFILTAPEDGTLFVDNTGTIKLVPLLRYRMKEVGLASKDYLCYWFRKNSSIKADSKKYLPIGGRGWEVLNGVLEDDDTSYVNDEFEYIVKSSEVYLKGEYKCVLVPVTNVGENQTPESLETGYFEAEIILDKLSAGIDISLTSDAEGITCNSTAIVTLVANIKYQATEESVIIFNYSRYNQDNNYVEDNFGEVKSTIVKETEGTLTNTYEIEQRYSFKAGIIPNNSFNTIKCSFGTLTNNDQIQDIGEASLIIRTGDTGKYILNAYGEAFYKYDEYGNAPNLETYAGSGTRIVQLKPVSFEMVNSNGNLFTPEEYVGWTFTWGFPKNSLIEVDIAHWETVYDKTEDDNYYYLSSNQYSLNKISYEISRTFDKTKAENNTILLTLTNGTDSVIGNVPITFTKDGLSGTNGSSYSAVVVAKVTNPEIKDNQVARKRLGTWPNSDAVSGYAYNELVPEVNNLPAKLQAFYYQPDDQVPGKWYVFFPNWMSRFTENTDPNDWISNDYLAFDKAVPTFDVRVMKEGKLIAKKGENDKSTTEGYSVEWKLMTSTDTRGLNRDSNVYVNFVIDDKGKLSLKEDNNHNIMHWDDDDKVFFNIVQARIKVANKGLVGDATAGDYEYLYAYYPIEVTKIRNINAFPTGNKIEVFPQLSGGFDEVIYRSDGLAPVYENNENFVLNNYNPATEENQDLYEYTWAVSRNLYFADNGSSIFDDDEEEHSDSALEQSISRIIKPVSNFDNGINANYVKVEYDYNASKKSELETTRASLADKIPILNKNHAYITVRQEQLTKKLNDLKTLEEKYGSAYGAYDERYRDLMQKLVVNEKDLNNESYFNTNDILGSVQNISLFATKYIKEELESLRDQVEAKCGELKRAIKNHLKQLKLLNDNPDAIVALEILDPFDIESYHFIDENFRKGIKANIIINYMTGCNILISEYNTTFTTFKNNDNLTKIFSDLATYINNAVNTDCFTTAQVPGTYEEGTIEETPGEADPEGNSNEEESSGDDSISIILSTDLNPVESELVGEDIVDYYINKTLIKVLASYAAAYTNTLTWYETIKNVIEPLLNLIPQVEDQKDVYTEYLESWIEERDLIQTEVNNLDIKIQYLNDNTNLNILHIKPILFLTTTVNDRSVHGWDGSSALVKKDDDIGEIIYHAQVKAGEWDPMTDDFVGLMMGVKKTVDPVGKKHFMRGMFGYGPNEQGGGGAQQTLLLNADTGQMILGDRLASRITIDPHYQVTKLNGDKETAGVIYSGNFFKEYTDDGTWMPTKYTEDNEAHAGMLIDLSTPEIRFGNGNFELDSFGNLYAAGEGQIAAWSLEDSKLTSNNITKGNQSMTLLSGKKAVYWTTSKVNPQPLNSISDLPSYSSGEITYDINDQNIQKDNFDQPMAVLIKKSISEGINNNVNPPQVARTRTVLRKAYVDDNEHVPAIYSNNHDSIGNDRDTGFYLSQEGLSILGKYQTREYYTSGNNAGIEKPANEWSLQTSRIEINTTNKPKFFSGSKETLTTKSKGFYIGEDGISLYSPYYVRSVGNDGAYEKIQIKINGTLSSELYEVYKNGDKRIVNYLNEEVLPNRYEFRVIDNLDNLTSEIKLPKIKKSGLVMSVDELKMPSLYSKDIGDNDNKDSLTNTEDGFYLSDCGFSLGSKFKVTQAGVAYIGYNAVQKGGLENGKFWTINGNTRESYISYNTNYLKYEGISTPRYEQNAIFLSTEGFRIGRTFLIDTANDLLMLGNLNSSNHRYWELKGDTGNAYLAYSCSIEQKERDGKSVNVSDYGSCIYKKTETINSSRRDKVESVRYYIKDAGSDEDMDQSTDDLDDEEAPDNVYADENDEICEDSGTEMNTDETDSETNYYGVNTNDSVYVGTNGIRIGRHFAVNNSGEAVLKAGTIGGWTINNNKIMSVLGVSEGGQVSGTKKYMIEMDSKKGLACYKLTYKKNYNQVQNPEGDPSTKDPKWYFKDKYKLTEDTILKPSKKYYTYVTTSGEFREVANPPSGSNPKANSWYEKTEDTQYILATETTVISGRKYYINKGDYWVKKNQWYLKPNGRAYFRKFQVKSGGESNVQVDYGRTGNFAVTPEGLSGGVISGTESTFLNSYAERFRTGSEGGQGALITDSSIDLYAAGGTRCINLVPNTACGMSLTSNGCYIGEVINGAISTDYKVMTRAEVVDLINTALDGLSLTSTSATQNTSPDFMTGVTVTNPEKTGEGGSSTEPTKHKHDLGAPTVNPSKSSITYISSALSKVTLNKPHIT